MLSVIMNRRHAAVAAVAAVAFGTGCASSRTASRLEIAPSPGAVVVAVRTTDFTFDPPVIRLPAGKLVRLELTNAGLIDHDVMLHELAVSGARFPRGQHMHGEYIAAHAAAGQRAWVEFIPGAPGAYDVSCSVMGHREAGMAARLVVE
jgi:uncharacterized cupredoxin-like copper-binding protein